MQQIIVIHGGSNFETPKKCLAYLQNREVTIDNFKPRTDWKDNLQKDLGNNFEVLSPHMPNHTNANYEEWKIWFERMFPFVRDNVILIGHSLGGVFLPKYLSENTFPKKIRGTYLVAPPYDDEGLGDESLLDFSLPESLAQFAEQSPVISIFHSADDPVVPFSHAEKYNSALQNVKLIKLEGRGHINQEEFLEILEKIQELSKTQHHSVPST